MMEQIQKIVPSEPEEYDIETIVTELGEELYEVDVVIVDQEDLDEFVDAVGGPQEIPDGFPLYTEDGHTRGRMEFNFIVADEDSYGIVTQINQPTLDADSVLDLRKNKHRGFADYIQGLEPVSSDDESE